MPITTSTTSSTLPPPSSPTKYHQSPDKQNNNNNNTPTLLRRKSTIHHLRHWLSQHLPTPSSSPTPTSPNTKLLSKSKSKPNLRTTKQPTYRLHAAAAAPPPIPKTKTKTTQHRPRPKSTTPSSFSTSISASSSSSSPTPSTENLNTEYAAYCRAFSSGLTAESYRYADCPQQHKHNTHSNVQIPTEAEALFTHTNFSPHAKAKPVSEPEKDADATQDPSRPIPNPNDHATVIITNPPASCHEQHPQHANGAENEKSETRPDSTGGTPPQGSKHRKPRTKPWRIGEVYRPEDIWMLNAGPDTQDRLDHDQEDRENHHDHDHENRPYYGRKEDWEIEDTGGDTTTNSEMDMGIGIEHLKKEDRTSTSKERNRNTTNNNNNNTKDTEPNLEGEEGTTTTTTTTTTTPGQHHATKTPEEPIIPTPNIQTQTQTQTQTQEILHWIRHRYSLDDDAGERQGFHHPEYRREHANVQKETDSDTASDTNTNATATNHHLRPRLSPPLRVLTPARYEQARRQATQKQQLLGANASARRDGETGGKGLRTKKQANNRKQHADMVGGEGGQTNLRGNLGLQPLQCVSPARQTERMSSPVGYAIAGGNMAFLLFFFFSV
ncbi:uncharacterized protein BO97DRAFT_401957 [Aspergillus homomorphus CBS 101889]|uniref:Uncharacterized protein n=1 Tax=Aspergillus homomorphus (strain CBS 101889) TaxID=1450537 RepID=A0A395IB74_ASPHC|nr:hypothetical protein BO97DRAFT_401957 [Aspergillus homomorphus CBS 101889]RAL17296.1 hypothetical protein BO97DRAFT_401957 [Aspergillus homomorphus CBS 101889]